MNESVQKERNFAIHRLEREVNEYKRQLKNLSEEVEKKMTQFYNFPPENYANLPRGYFTSEMSGDMDWIKSYVKKMQNHAIAADQELAILEALRGVE